MPSARLAVSSRMPPRSTPRVSHGAWAAPPEPPEPS
jgi:hypothetical protein